MLTVPWPGNACFVMVWTPWPLSCWLSWLVLSFYPLMPSKLPDIFYTPLTELNSFYYFNCCWSCIFFRFCLTLTSFYFWLLLYSCHYCSIKLLTSLLPRVLSDTELWPDFWIDRYDVVRSYCVKDYSGAQYELQFKFKFQQYVSSVWLQPLPPIL